MTFTATIEAETANTTAQGTVTFRDGSKVLDKVQVSGGSASMTVTNLTPGSHQITATFEPTDKDTFSSSTSTTLNYLITLVGGNSPGNSNSR